MSENSNQQAIAIIENDTAIAHAQQRHNEVMAIRQQVFQPGVHYGPPYKGAKNDTLLKPGATFLQQKYGLREHHERIETTIHVEAEDMSKSYIIIQDRCRIYDADGVEIAQADAACTTFEDKYLYRGGGDRVCPECGNASIMRSAYPPRNNPNAEKGWYCNGKNGGCGKSFDYDTPVIKDQEVSKKRNENPLNLLDTIVAMAQKRSSVRSTIKATGVDALFSPGDGVTVDYMDTPDTGDVVDGAVKVIEKPATPKHAPEPPIAAPNVSDIKDAPKPAPASGGTWVYDYQALMKDKRVQAAYEQTQHRASAINLLKDAGWFNGCANLDEAVAVVVERPDKQQPDTKAS